MNIIKLNNKRSTTTAIIHRVIFLTENIIFKTNYKVIGIF